jgi:hypothetical protein
MFIRHPIYAASPNLVWKPYLEQITDTGVIISWTTQTGTNPRVQYSIDTSYSTSSPIGTTRTLSALNTKLNHVVLNGLLPNTTYNYKIYTNNEDLLPGELLSFQTAPTTGSTTPFTFLAFGDYGTAGSAQLALRDQMQRDSFRFILTTGDNAYEDALYTDFDTKVFQVYRDIFPRAPIFPSMGNHEYHISAGAAYLDLFDLPATALRAADQERYYSFDYGNAHIVVLDSNTPLDADDSAAADDMFDWLRNDLSQTTQRWKIVAFHHSPYSIGAFHGSDSRVQSKLVPIFETYGVDLVLTGHDHTYQRSAPLRGGQVTTVADGGIVYVVSGAGEKAADRCDSAVAWIVFARCSQSYGLYSRITVDGDGLTVEAVNYTGVVEDSFVFGQPSMPPTATPTPAPPVTSLTFADEADARVEEANPSSTYGTSTSLQAVVASNASVESYLRFTVTGVSQAVLSAKLRVHVATNGTANGPAAYATSNSWLESKLTWNTRPAPTSSATDNKGAIGTNIWVDYDVTSLVQGNGTYSFVFRADSSDSVSFSSKEGSFPPQLVLTLAVTTPTSTATASPTNTPTATPTSTATATPSNTPTDTPTGTLTSTPTPTPTTTPTASPTTTPTNTPTATPTATPTNTPTATPASADVIFADGFETGNLSACTSSQIDGGDLSVSAAGALVGSKGLQALIDDNNTLQVVDDRPNAEPRYRARFYFDPNGIVMGSSDAHYLFQGYAGTSTVVLRVEFRRSSGAYQIRARLVNDGSTWTSSNWFTISDAPHAIELDWRAATAAGATNGGLTLWIDGAQQANLTGVDNDTRRIDRARLGAVSGIDSGTRGTYYFDAFESRRQTYIGP